MHSQENCWQSPNGRYGQTPMIEHPRSSHFVDFEGDQILVHVLRGEQRGPSMGYRNNNGLRRSELKCFNCQGPHMVSECPTKHEYYNRMAQRPRHTPLEAPPQHRYKVSINSHRTLSSGSKEKHHALGVVKNT